MHVQCTCIIMKFSVLQRVPGIAWMQPNPWYIEITHKQC